MNLDVNTIMDCFDNGISTFLLGCCDFDMPVHMHDLGGAPAG